MIIVLLGISFLLLIIAILSLTSIKKTIKDIKELEEEHTWKYALFILTLILKFLFIFK